MTSPNYATVFSINWKSVFGLIAFHIKKFRKAPDSLLYRVGADWLPDDVRGGRIEHVAVERATITSTVRRGARITVDSTAELTLAMRGLELDSTRHRIFEYGTLTAKTLIHATPGRGDSLVLEGPSITVGAEDTAYAVVVARTAPWDGSHALRIYGVRRSQVRQSLTVDSLFYAVLVLGAVGVYAVRAPDGRVLPRPLAFAGYLVLGVAASVEAWYKLLVGNEEDATWEPTRRRA